MTDTPPTAAPRPTPRLPTGFGTRAIHAGTAGEHGSVNTPVYLSTTYQFDDERYAGFAGGDRTTLLYGRLTHPNAQAVATKLAALEGAEGGLVFATGMAAISTTLLGLLSHGDHIVANPDVYGGTYGVLTAELPRFGIDVTFADMRDPASYEAAITPATRILYVETISNPVLKVADLDAYADIARRHDLLLLVDNTFATPWAVRPLEHGADLVLHSMTKYLNGHSDALGGAVVGSEALIEQLFLHAVYFGGSMDPHQAYLIERGMRTLDVRMPRACENAIKLADAISGHPAVSDVIHPLHADHPDHALATRLMPLGTGMLSFVLKGGDAATLPFMRSLHLAMEATSLGGVESLVEAPFNSSHVFVPEHVRHASGLVPGFIRFSVGCETAEDLIADVLQALDGLVDAGFAAAAADGPMVRHE